MTYTVCYVSKATEGLGETEIEDVFATTLKNNAEKNIYGILLYGMGNFFQVLEGNKKTVESLYEQEIKNDTRHYDVFEIMRKTTQGPIFSSYSSVFTIVKTNEQLEQIKTYLRQNKVNTTSDKLSRLLNPFLLDL
ncbi:BLUF domain-containing protein [Marinirhabdus gelatinilytica]|uniref:FAD-dependent sensor of blue light n=1 Tax=Marinirhabdus gelatinilytica TaxID=1703343 RepID=A0A370Q824_9FLAO|nr:BLUF domain-containing protein [Marinirhabdus gelatinilytica]RDK84200.1 FAD-dependent sensor of blue light [Marinirhabdus gelatinilytica]